LHVLAVVHIAVEVKTCIPENELRQIDSGFVVDLKGKRREFEVYFHLIDLLVLEVLNDE